MRIVPQRVTRSLEARAPGHFVGEATSAGAVNSQCTLHDDQSDRPTDDGIGLCSETLLHPSFSLASLLKNQA